MCRRPCRRRATGPARIGGGRACNVGARVRRVGHAVFVVVEVGTAVGVFESVLVLGLVGTLVEPIDSRRPGLLSGQPFVFGSARRSPASMGHASSGRARRRCRCPDRGSRRRPRTRRRPLSGRDSDPRRRPRRRRRCPNRGSRRRPRIRRGPRRARGIDRRRRARRRDRRRARGEPSRPTRSTSSGGLPKAWVSDVCAPSNNETSRGGEPRRKPGDDRGDRRFLPAILGGLRRRHEPAAVDLGHPGPPPLVVPAERLRPQRDGGAPRHLVVERASEDVALLEAQPKAGRRLDGEGDELVLGEHAKLAGARPLAEVRRRVAGGRGVAQQRREAEPAERAVRNEIALRVEREIAERLRGGCAPRDGAGRRVVVARCGTGPRADRSRARTAGRGRCWR